MDFFSLGGFEMSWRLGAYARRVIAGKRRLPKRVVDLARQRVWDRQVRRYGNQAYDQLLRAHATGQRLGYRGPLPIPAGLAHMAAREEGRNRWLERRGWPLLPYDVAQRGFYNNLYRGMTIQELNWAGDLTE